MCIRWWNYVSRISLLLGDWFLKFKPKLMACSHVKTVDPMTPSSSFGHEIENQSTNEEGKAPPS